MPSKFDSQYRPMEYPVLGGASPVIDLASPVDPEQRIRELEEEIGKKEKHFALTLESVRKEALGRGKELASSEHSAWRQECAAELTAAIGEFRGHADEYLNRVEHEVVRLALAVAERILHRESQMDPLLLSGAVRIALGQLAESTKVRLRVPAAQEEMWAEMVRLMPGLPLRPEVRADQEMHTCEAVLETNLGTVDLGVRSQLREIERSFFDLPEVPSENGLETDRPEVAGKRG
ncbi:MAG: FliH/SctL family protein [Acidobacteriaceae bacterium]